MIKVYWSKEKRVILSHFKKMTLDIILFSHAQETVKNLFTVSNFCNSDNVAPKNPSLILTLNTIYKRWALLSRIYMLLKRLGIYCSVSFRFLEGREEPKILCRIWSSVHGFWNKSVWEAENSFKKGINTPSVLSFLPSFIKLFWALKTLLLSAVYKFGFRRIQHYAVGGLFF